MRKNFNMYLYCFVFCTKLAVSSQVVQNDLFLFEVDKEVYSFRGVKSEFKRLKNFSCMYPESVFVSLFKATLDATEISDFFSQKLSKKTKMSFKRDKKLLDQWVRYYKFKRYVKSSKVIVKEALISGLKLAAKKNGCSEEQFLSSRSISKELSTILRAEVLLRARFFSDSSSKQTLSKKVKESANLFITSIGKQYSESVYW